MFSHYYHTNQFYKVSTNFIVSSIPKCGCSTVAILSKCFHEHRDIHSFTDVETVHITRRYPSVFITVLSKYKVDCNKKENSKDKIVAIFRDPVERFKSIWGTRMVSHPCRSNFHENILRVKDKFKNQSPLDHHYIPLTMFYDFDKIDIFVELKDYKAFCAEHNIQWIMTNKNVTEEYQNLEVTEEEKELIKEIYKDDIELINKIRNSNKIYIPTNNE